MDWREAVAIIAGIVVLCLLMHAAVEVDRLRRDRHLK
jgi:hypothetical protein